MKEYMDFPPVDKSVQSTGIWFGLVFYVFVCPLRMWTANGSKLSRLDCPALSDWVGYNVRVMLPYAWLELAGCSYPRWIWLRSSSSSYSWSWLSWNLLSRPGWPQSQRYDCLCLGLKECTTAPSKEWHLSTDEDSGNWEQESALVIVFPVRCHARPCRTSCQ